MNPLNTVESLVGFVRNVKENVQHVVQDTNALLIPCFSNKKTKTQSTLNSGFFCTSPRNAKVGLLFTMRWDTASICVTLVMIEGMFLPR